MLEQMIANALGLALEEIQCIMEMDLEYAVMIRSTRKIKTIRKSAVFTYTEDN